MKNTVFVMIIVAVSYSSSLGCKGVKCGPGTVKKNGVCLVAGTDEASNNEASSLAAGQGTIRGRFVASGEGLITAIVFDPDAMMATLESALFAFSNGKMVYPYKATGTKIYIHDPQKGDVPFTIQDKDTIVCEMKIFGDVYKRR